MARPHTGLPPGSVPTEPTVGEDCSVDLQMLCGDQFDGTTAGATGRSAAATAATFAISVAAARTATATGAAGANIDAIIDARIAIGTISSVAPTAAGLTGMAGIVVVFALTSGSTISGKLASTISTVTTGTAVLFGATGTRTASGGPGTGAGATGRRRSVMLVAVTPATTTATATTGKSRPGGVERSLHDDHIGLHAQSSGIHSGGRFHRRDRYIITDHDGLSGSMDLAG